MTIVPAMMSRRYSDVEEYRSLNGINPAFMCNHFMTCDSGYNFRDQNAALLPKCTAIRYGRKCFRYYGASACLDNVPSHIKCAPPLNSFKDLIRSWSGPSCSCVLCQAP